MKPASISNLRRHELGKATYDVIAKIGVRQLTIERVAAHAGIAKGVAYHYFRKKEELIVHAVLYANQVFARDFLEILRNVASTSERLWAIIDAQLSEEYLAYNYLRAYLQFLVVGFSKSEIARIYGISDRRGRSNIVFALKTMMEARDAQVAASTILSFIEGAWLVLPGWPEVTRAEILSSIKEYLINYVPGFDPSVIDTFKSAAPKFQPRNTRVPTSTIRRMELEKAALDILYESGFRELTIQRVAEKAQLSKGVVHHYFLSKDDLVAGALRHEFREYGLAVTRLLEKASDPSERLWIVINTQLADQYLQFSYLRWYLNSIEAGFRNKGISQVYDIAEQRGRSNIAAALKDLMPVAEARKTTLVLWSMIEGSCYMIFSERTITRKHVLLGIARYLTCSIPKFDSSVIVIDGARAADKIDRSSRPEPTTSIAPERIHEAAREVVEHVGYRKLTFELLAEHMGVTVEAIQRHYESITDLIVAAVRSIIAGIGEIGEQRRNQAKSGSEALWSFVYSDIELCINTRHSEAYVLLLEFCRTEPQLLEIYEADEQSSRLALASELRRFGESAVDNVLANLHTMLHGAWMLRACDPATTHSDILRSISEYLTYSVPGFDPSVLELSAQWRVESGRPEGQ